MRLEDRVDIDATLEHSYRDFHAKGLDYICLKRSPKETWKLYFFDGACSSSPEVVYPHDHRYDFKTTVLAGAVENIVYTVSHSWERGAKPYHRFSWLTPLNPGPSGFTFLEACYLMETGSHLYSPRGGAHYFMRHSSFHTIRIAAPDTVLLLRQDEDRVPMGVATSTFSRGDAPKTAGLYSRWRKCDLVKRLEDFEKHSGIQLKNYRGTHENQAAVHEASRSQARHG